MQRIKLIISIVFLAAFIPSTLLAETTNEPAKQEGNGMMNQMQQQCRAQMQQDKQALEKAHAALKAARDTMKQHMQACRSNMMQEKSTMEKNANTRTNQQNNGNQQAQ